MCIKDSCPTCFISLVRKSDTTPHFDDLSIMITLKINKQKICNFIKLYQIKLYHIDSCHLCWMTLVQKK